MDSARPRMAALDVRAFAIGVRRRSRCVNFLWSSDGIVSCSAGSVLLARAAGEGGGGSTCPSIDTTKKFSNMYALYSMCCVAKVCICAGMSVRSLPPLAFRTRAKARLMANPRPQFPKAPNAVYMRVILRIVEISLTPEPGWPSA